MTTPLTPSINAIFDGIFAIPTEAVDPDTGRVSRVDPVVVKDAALAVVAAERWNAERLDREPRERVDPDLRAVLVRLTEIDQRTPIGDCMSLINEALAATPDHTVVGEEPTLDLEVPTHDHDTYMHSHGGSRHIHRFASNPEATMSERVDPDLRAALDRPESKLARAIGKVRLGGTRDGHFFDEDGWRFLLEAVAEARAALRERRERVDPDLLARIEALPTVHTRADGGCVSRTEVLAILATEAPRDPNMDYERRDAILDVVRRAYPATPDHTVVEEEPEWVTLAADIRAVDGNHDLGAGELAERLTERGWSRATPRPR